MIPQATFFPRDYQDYAARALFDFVHVNPKKNPLIVMPTGCHAAGHEILMYDGSIKLVEDVQVGDKLMGPDSGPREVLALARGRQEMRRIVPTKGEPFVVNLDHKLSVKKVQEGNNSLPSRQARVETITVREYENGSDWYRHLRKLRRVPVDFAEADLPLDPYTLGALIGDGCLTGRGVRFSSTTKEIVDRMGAGVAEHGCYISAESDGISYNVVDPQANRATPNRVAEVLRSLGHMGCASADHFLHKSYLCASRRQRMELLAGLIDAEGYLDGNGWEYVTISTKLAKDVQFLCRSLGFSCSKKESWQTVAGKPYRSFRLQIHGHGLEEVPVELERKRPGPRRQKKDPLVTGFTVEKLPEDNYYGFTLDKDHLYLDSNLVVHHNTGKSGTMGFFMYMWLHYYPRSRFLSVVHVKELVEGNMETMLKIMPTAPVGCYSAGLKRKETHGQITFAGIASIAKKAAQFGHIDFLIVDEAHMISDKEQTLYNKLIRALKAVNPWLVVIGFTATDYRMKTGMLTEGDLFDDIVVDMSSGEAFLWFVNNGYLSKPVPRPGDNVLDSGDVGIKGGEFDAKQASQAMRDQNVLEKAVDMCILLGEQQGRQAWLHFNQSIDDAELVADMFTYKGYPHEAVHSKRSDSDEVLRAFREGGLRGVTNMEKLTTGYDQPNIDLIGMMRLTRSPGLWVQMLGRGTRPLYSTWDGYDMHSVMDRLKAIAASPKQNCLVLDFVGNTQRLGPINFPQKPKRRKKGKGGGEAPVRQCPECQTYHHTSVKVCDTWLPDREEYCGYEFPLPQKIKDAGTDALVKEGEEQEVVFNTPPEKEYEIIGVHRMVLTRNLGKNGKKDTLLATYYNGSTPYRVWVCFEHDAKSFPRRQAINWWTMHQGEGEAPTDIDEVIAATESLRLPKFIKVWVNTKFDTIEDYDFMGTRFELPPHLGGPPLQEPEPDPTADNRSASAKEREDQLMKEMFDSDIPF